MDKLEFNNENPILGIKETSPSKKLNIGGQQTALQELIEWFDELPEYDKSSEGYSIIEKAKELLHKEKESIIKSYNEGFKKSAEGWNGECGINDMNNLEEEIGSEKFYNQTYGEVH
jgi:hypothetical protein